MNPKRVSQFSSGDKEIQLLQQKYLTISSLNDKVKKFDEFPISQKTITGLKDSKYLFATNIQRESIFPALLGKNVLGAAPTGSGKTLAFLIPVLEVLYVKKWTRTDGIGAVIISPTRELAYQTFETLKHIGKYHDFSAGLIIGGKNLKFERNRMDQCNILICTPGRLLQHMDENPLFNSSTMQVLVLDEADRCLDMGFEQTINAIFENFPPEHQTLLFSATQTNSFNDLTRLNLRDPVYIGLKNDSRPLKLPDLLQQHYVVISLEEKITMLWSFIKNHLKQKIIVFLCSCKQVKYFYEIFCKLRPGTSLLALYGTLHQDRRISIYNEFVRKSNVVLFATDIASRGLDFPTVNWVVQLDCPEDVTQYVHRAGRSARNKTRGESLLVLTPSEENAMIAELKKHHIYIKNIQIDSKKLFSPRIKIEAFLAQNQELKAAAQRAFTAYIKSIFLMKNKSVFNAFTLNFDAFARSLGLIITPRIRFLDRFVKNKEYEDIKLNNNILQDKNKFQSQESSSESDDEFLKVKRINHEIKPQEEIEEKILPPFVIKEKLITKASLAKKILKKKIQINEKLRFDEEGSELIDGLRQINSNIMKECPTDLNTFGGIDISFVKNKLSAEDVNDKRRFKDLVKHRHRKLKNEFKNYLQKGSQSMEVEDNHDHYIDLSWLPEPRKLFDSVNEQTNILNNSESKKYVEENAPRRKKLKINQNLSLGDTEAIASHLLEKS